jgi:cytoskeletal protein RodZ
MERFGDYLKRKREEKNITVEGIARITKIQPYILRAIENNDIENLPHQTFVKGFIKNYCRALKIPWDKALSLFDEEQEIKVRDDSQKEIEILQKRKETSMIHRGLSFSPLVIAMIVLFRLPNLRCGIYACVYIPSLWPLAVENVPIGGPFLRKSPQQLPVSGRFGMA